MLAENKALKAKVDALEKGRTEFFRVDIGDGIALDGWCILPPDFDASAKYPVAGARLRRAGRSDGARSLGGRQLPLAPDAGPERIHRHELRQPRHARAARPGLAQVGLSSDRHAGPQGPGRGA